MRETESDARADHEQMWNCDRQWSGPPYRRCYRMINEIYEFECLKFIYLRIPSRDLIF